MQTFLPYPDFKKSVQCLDYRRLGKQRLEAKQIYNIITGQAKSNAWKNHPIVLMWKDNPHSLAKYHNECIWEWIKRGYKNTMPILMTIEEDLPSWFGNKKFHASHRSNLLRKNKEWYSQFNWNEPDNLPYEWIINNEINTCKQSIQS